MMKVSTGFALPCLAGASLALSIVGMASAQDQPRFGVTDLGKLGFVPDPDDEGTFGISNRGEVVYSIDVNGQRHARLWLPEPNYNLPAGNHDLSEPGLFPPFDQPSIARDISLQGKIAGQHGGILAGEGEAMVWDLATATLQPLGFLPGAIWSRAFAISDPAFPVPSVVVGESEHLEICREDCDDGPPFPQPDIFWHSFRATVSGTPTLIPVPSIGCDPSSLALDVSTVPGGTRIAGSSDERGPTDCLPFQLCNMTSKDAVIWADPLLLIELPGLDDPDNLLDSEARGVNTAGQSVGWVYKPDQPGAGCKIGAAFWDANTSFTHLGAFMPQGQAGNQSRAEAVSNLPEPWAVGWNVSNNLALLWENQGGGIWTVTDLNTVIGPCGGPGGNIVLRQGHDINDDSWIITWGEVMINNVLERHAYLLRPTNTCLGDLTGDGVVNILDLLTLLLAWGPCTDGEFCFADLNCDGEVSILDLLILLAAWGNCPGHTGDLGPSLEEVLNDAGLTMDDWDLYLDCLTTGTPEEQANCQCWFDRYINGCPVDCSQLPACGGADPFNECPGDFNGDCTTDSADLTILLGCWGIPCGDLTGDCTTDSDDLTIVLGNWGACPLDPLCGPGPESTCGESAQGGGGSSHNGSGDDPSLTAALDEMGFDSVDEYEDWLIDASDSEAFESASLLQALLEAQP